LRIRINCENPDWLTSLLGAVAEGVVSEKYKNPSFVPALAEGVEFGKRWPRYY
jgi:hypothetical protein